MEFDTIVKNGFIVTASEILPSSTEIGIRDGKITCLGTSLPASANTQIIDAKGGYITPGGVDSHVHIAQENSPTGDNWETGSRAAIAGGTTTVLAFVETNKTDESVLPLVAAYHDKSRGQSYCDYGFHVMFTSAREKMLKEELPKLVEDGITSVKLYMTYESKKLVDRELLDIMMRTRELGMTTMIHAENHDMIDLITERLEARGLTEPYYHALARPQLAETEATYRAISIAQLTDAPILLVHLSSPEALSHVRKAQTKLLPIHAETCPHYLYLTSDCLKASKHDHFSGAKHVCSPPLRHSPQDLAVLWNGLNNGSFTTISSDHAPDKYDHPIGKRKGEVKGFRYIPNGLPGIETRMPLLWDPEKLPLIKFVQLACTNPAKMYGLDGVKGSIAPGYDADLAVWYPDGWEGVEILQENLHHGLDYTPFEGMKAKNWPRMTILRGKIVWDRENGGIVGAMEDGAFLRRQKGKILTGKTGALVDGMYEGERSLWM